MESTGFQLLLFALGGLILLVAWPARRRINSRDLPTEIAKLRSQLQDRATEDTEVSSASNEEQGEEGQPEAVHPLEKYLEACLKRGVRPTPVEVDTMCRRLARKNYYVPPVFEFLAEYDNRQAEIARRKSGSGVFSFPEQAMPNNSSSDQAPATENATEDNTGGAESATGSGSGGNMRSVTLAALVHLPKVITEVPAPDFDTLSIPLLYDGSTWAWLPLTAGNHSGVFGMTRSGKGNAVQHILLQALTFGPELVRAIVLDAKGGLDYAFCDDLEHADLYSDKTISDGLQVALTEMESRKTILRAGRYRNHYEYQKKTGKTLPLIVVIADELTQFTDEQNEQLVTLACVSGAMGFILLLATQHPLAKYLPTPVQANVGFRLVFRLASSEHIRIALKRTRDDEGTYNPALIGANMKGVGVLRGPGGDEILGRVPEVTDVARDALIAELVNRWPKDIKRVSGSVEPVPAKILSFERGTGGTTSELVEEPPEEPTTELVRPNETLVMESLLLAGLMSKNKILEHLGGNRKKRLEQLSEIEGRLKSEGRLKGEQSNG